MPQELSSLGLYRISELPIACCLLERKLFYTPGGLIFGQLLSVESMQNDMSRLVLVSNRLPFTIEKSGNESRLRQSTGGLVSAIKSYFEKSKSDQNNFAQKIWIGSVDFSPQDLEEVNDELTKQEFTIEPVQIEENIYNDYYNGFSNSAIWPLFHYFPSLLETRKEYFEAYKHANQQFAEKIISILQDDDILWIHDYQLMLLPLMVRKKKPSAKIGFFLHIPFPSYELFRLLPADWKMAILSGILGADLVGFHTHEYVQYFIRSVKMVLKIDNQFNNLLFENRLVRVDLFPLGVDFGKFNSSNDEINKELVKIKEAFPDKKIIFSADRQDYSKGLMDRLHGYDLFLQDHSEWKEKVVYIQNVVPSRDNIPAYMERKKMLEELISTINGKHSSIQWQPIIYRYNHLEFDQLNALYKSADVALITPLRDGMNLVAKEYVASRNDLQGVLVLSELTGAASELSEALLVNPFDRAELAIAINQALLMPKMEQQQRMELMQKLLKEYDVEKWMTDFLDQLHTIKQEQEKLRMKLLDADALKKLIQQYQSSQRRLLLLDYDGTLAPFTKIPSQAKPTDEMIDTLRKLTGDKRNEVVVISGRDQKTLDSWLGLLPLSLVAEHGSSIKLKGGEWEKQFNIQPGWKDRIRPIMQLFASRCAGSLVEEKENTLVWHYRNASPELGFIRSRELMNTISQLINNTSLQVMDGSRVLEVRHSGVDKGTTAMKLLNKFAADFVLCIGDDVTDEDMFSILKKKGFTIKIGNGATAADYYIPHQSQVLPLLFQIINPSNIAEKNAYT
jgi:trehalose 6-phosphate synthase/phosphatase